MTSWKAINSAKIPIETLKSLTKHRDHVKEFNEILQRLCNTISSDEFVDNEISGDSMRELVELTRQIPPNEAILEPVFAVCLDLLHSHVLSINSLENHPFFQSHTEAIISNQKVSAEDYLEVSGRACQIFDENFAFLKHQRDALLLSEMIECKRNDRLLMASTHVLRAAMFCARHQQAWPLDVAVYQAILFKCFGLKSDAIVQGRDPCFTASAAKLAHQFEQHLCPRPFPTLQYEAYHVNLRITTSSNDLLLCELLAQCVDLIINGSKHCGEIWLRPLHFEGPPLHPPIPALNAKSNETDENNMLPSQTHEPTGFYAEDEEHLRASKRIRVKKQQVAQDTTVTLSQVLLQVFGIQPVNWSACLEQTSKQSNLNAKLGRSMSEWPQKWQSVSDFILHVQGWLQENCRYDETFEGSFKKTLMKALHRFRDVCSRNIIIFDDSAGEDNFLTRLLWAEWFLEAKDVLPLISDSNSDSEPRILKLQARWAEMVGKWDEAVNLWKLLDPKHPNIAKTTLRQAITANKPLSVDYMRFSDGDELDNESLCLLFQYYVHFEDGKFAWKIFAPNAKTILENADDPVIEVFNKLHPESNEERVIFLQYCLYYYSFSSEKPLKSLIQNTLAGLSISVEPAQWLSVLKALLIEPECTEALLKRVINDCQSYIFSHKNFSVSSGSESIIGEDSALIARQLIYASWSALYTLPPLTSSSNMINGYFPLSCMTDVTAIDYNQWKCMLHSLNKANILLASRASTKAEMAIQSTLQAHLLHLLSTNCKDIMSALKPTYNAVKQALRLRTNPELNFDNKSENLTMVKWLIKMHGENALHEQQFNTNSWFATISGSKKSTLTLFKALKQCRHMLKCSISETGFGWSVLGQAYIVSAVQALLVEESVHSDSEGEIFSKSGFGSAVKFFLRALTCYSFANDTSEQEVILDVMWKMGVRIVPDPFRHFAVGESRKQSLLSMIHVNDSFLWKARSLTDTAEKAQAYAKTLLNDVVFMECFKECNHITDNYQLNNQFFANIISAIQSGNREVFDRSVVLDAWSAVFPWIKAPKSSLFSSNTIDLDSLKGFRVVTTGWIDEHYWTPWAMSKWIAFLLKPEHMEDAFMIDLMCRTLERLKYRRHAHWQTLSLRIMQGLSASKSITTIFRRRMTMIARHLPSVSGGEKKRLLKEPSYPTLGDIDEDLFAWPI